MTDYDQTVRVTVDIIVYADELRGLALPPESIAVACIPTNDGDIKLVSAEVLATA